MNAPGVAPKVPKPAKERGKIAPAKFAHVALRTGNYEAMIEWYSKVLEAEIVLGSPMASFLTYDDEHHRLAILNMPGLKPQDRSHAGTEHIAYTYESLDDLFATYERLQSLGIMPFWTIHHGGTLSLYYHDPDQTQVELQVDVFDTHEAFAQWLETSDFAVNPVGVKVDLPDMIARYRAGEDRASLLDRPRIDPSQVMAQMPGPGPT